MEISLTDKELDDVAKRVSEKIFENFVEKGTHSELQSACEKRTKELIDYYLSENHLSYDVSKMVAPIFDEHLKATNIVEDHLRSYMNTEHFKKIELKHLKARVNQIEQELEEYD